MLPIEVDRPPFVDARREEGKASLSLSPTNRAAVNAFLRSGWPFGGFRIEAKLSNL